VNGTEFKNLKRKMEHVMELVAGSALLMEIIGEDDNKDARIKDCIDRNNRAVKHLDLLYENLKPYCNDCHNQFEPDSDDLNPLQCDRCLLDRDQDYRDELQRNLELETL